MHGEVQGVFFRNSCQAEAQAVGVTGWVRNTSSGTVEAVFEGPADSVEQLVGWCRNGSDQAEVDLVEVQAEEPLGETAFVVR